MDSLESLRDCDCNCDGGSSGYTLNPVENLEAAIGIGTVDLTWDVAIGALSYTVFRNGVEIAEVTETTYTDEVYSEIHFTYCVVVNYRQGSSVPECIDVMAELDVEENANTFAIYPNPVSGTLHIDGGNAEYSYMLYNGMGQVVASGKAQGAEHISVDGMTQGIYFLHLTSGTQVRIEKVVVK